MAVVRATNKLLFINNFKFFKYFVHAKYNSTGKKLCYDTYGDPSEVVRLDSFDLQEPADNEVTVKMLAAPINPADLNTIQGVYPIKPPLPSIPGNEGVGEIINVGKNIKDLKVGDWVVPRGLAWGTWRTHAQCLEKQLQRISNELDVVAAATLTVNPCTAYRMLKDFVALEKGDVVIQNGGNSACGQAVIQLCKQWGYISVNIIRNRSNLDEIKTNLKALGADYVFTEEELPTLDIFKNGVPKPKLGLNCVGGKNCLNLLRHLNKSAHLVTYGGMSREPVTVPTSALIFKNIHINGYWMTEWVKQNGGSPDHVVMLTEIANFSKEKKLLPPAHQLVPITDYKQVLKQCASASGMTNMKLIFDFAKM